MRVRGRPRRSRWRSSWLRLRWAFRTGSQGCARRRSPPASELQWRGRRTGSMLCSFVGWWFRCRMRRCRKNRTNHCDVCFRDAETAMACACLRCRELISCHCRHGYAFTSLLSCNSFQAQSDHAISNAHPTNKPTMPNALFPLPDASYAPNNNPLIRDVPARTPPTVSR